MFFATITNWSKIAINSLILFEHENDEKENNKSYVLYALVRRITLFYAL
jgi:hypothetical protein